MAVKRKDKSEYNDFYSDYTGVSKELDNNLILVMSGGIGLCMTLLPSAEGTARHMLTITLILWALALLFVLLSMFATQFVLAKEIAKFAERRFLELPALEPAIQWISVYGSAVGSVLLVFGIGYGIAATVSVTDKDKITLTEESMAHPNDDKGMKPDDKKPSGTTHRKDINEGFRIRDRVESDSDEGGGPPPKQDGEDSSDKD